jgi:hypothetical protein
VRDFIDGTDGLEILYGTGDHQEEPNIVPLVLKRGDQYFELMVSKMSPRDISKIKAITTILEI